MGARKSKLKPSVPSVDRGKDEVTMRESEDSQNEMSFLDFLPLEIWGKILGKVKNPEDIVACCEVCDDWKFLLEDKIPSAYFQLILPKVAPFLDGSDYVNCSAVSKGLNAAVDTLVENRRRNTTFWYEDRARSRRRFYRNFYPFPLLAIGNKDDQTLEQFLSDKAAFGENQFDNPVPYRHVNISKDNRVAGQYMTHDQFEGYAESFSKFFKKFGKHIYQVELSFCYLTMLRLTKLMTICLSQTPNLEVLLLDNRLLLGGMYTVEDERRVDAFLAGSPFPDSTLKKLRICHVPNKIIGELLNRYGNQLEDLHDFVQVFKLIPEGIKLENLKVLRAKVNRMRVENFNILKTLTHHLRTMNWNLTKVEITLRPFANYSEKRFAKLSRALKEHHPHARVIWLNLYYDSA